MMELKSLLLVAVSSVVTLLFCKGAAAARKPPAGARRFLRTFPQYRRTGYPVIVNASFNVCGERIVGSPGRRVPLRFHLRAHPALKRNSSESFELD